MSKITPQETVRIQQYLQKTFTNSGITLRAREKATDSVEVLLNGEFIGTIYKDEEDNEVSYDFNMAILGIDLAA